MRLLLYLTAMTLLLSVKTERPIYAQDAMRENGNRAAAKSADDEGARLQREGTAESLRKAILKYEEALSLWRSGEHQAGEAETLTRAADVFNSLGERQNANY